jgi:hypothetical protein
MLDLQAHIEGARQQWRERFSCGVPACRGRRPWARIMDGTGSIRLHGQRLCFPLCFERELQRRLEELWVLRPQQPRPPHRVPLGLLMLSRSELNREQLRDALESQKQNGSRRIGEYLCQLGFVTEPHHGGARPAVVVSGAASIAGSSRRLRNSHCACCDISAWS